MPEKVKNSSDGAVIKATGKSWEEWFNALDNIGAGELSHKEIVALLKEQTGLESHWWRQNITNAYEKKIGRREFGEMSDGFQIGAQATFNISHQQAWDILFSKVGLETWLGKGTYPFPPEKEPYTAENGIEGEVRVVNRFSHVRLTYNDPGYEKISTLQVRVISKDKDKTVISFHQEKLENPEHREEMKTRWKETLSRLKKLFEEKTAE